MSEIQKRWVAYGIVAVAVIIAALLGMRYPMPEPPGEVVALGTTHFTNVEAEDITATDDLTVGDRLSVPIIAASDDMTVTDNLVVSDDSMLGNAPAHKLFDLVTVNRLTDIVKPARSFLDYNFQIDRDNVPQGVTLDDKI